MKILMVHPHEVFSRLEPWTTRIVSFAEEFIKSGHQVRVVYFPLEWVDAPRSFQRKGIEFIPFCRRAGVYRIFKNCLKMSGLANWADVVHFQKCFHYASLPALINSWILNKPLHYDWDDWEEMIYYESADPPLKPVGLFLRVLERTIPAIVDTISVSSQRLRALCIELGIEPDIVFHVPVGADVRKFHPSVTDDRIKKLYRIHHPLVLYLGQLHGGQYVKLFIESAKIILDKGIKADFMIVGDGVRSAELKQKAKDFNVDEKIIFTGAVDAAEVPEYVASCDIAVACFEDNEVTRCKSPLKIAEYLASGKPIVASRVGEVGKMIADAGILVEPGTANPLADTIIALLGDKELRARLGTNARRRAENVYNWKASSEILLKAYQVAIDKNESNLRHPRRI